MKIKIFISIILFIPSILINHLNGQMKDIYNFESKRKAEEFFYSEVAKYPNYIGWFWNWNEIFYQVRFTPPKDHYCITIKIHGRI